MADQDEGVKPEGETETPDTTPVSEQTAEVEQDAAPSEAPDTSEESTKKGYSARVRELNQRAKDAEAEAESLQKKLEELTANVKPGENVPTFEPLTPLINPGEDITGDE